MGKAMGFNPVNIKYIVLKSLDLFASGVTLNEAIYIEEIDMMNN